MNRVLQGKLCPVGKEMQCCVQWCGSTDINQRAALIFGKLVLVVPDTQECVRGNQLFYLV